MSVHDIIVADAFREITSGCYRRVTIGVVVKTSILIVDDLADSCEVLAVFLRQDGYETKIVHSGAEALLSIAVSRPSLVVLDDFMPGLSGLDVMLELRLDRQYQSLPIIMLTAGKDPERHATALNLGVADVFVKGQTPWETIGARIASLIGPGSSKPAD